MRSHLLLLLPCLAAAIPAGAAALQPVTLDESRDWIRHLLPLPKEVLIEGKAVVPVSSLRIELPAGATDLDRCAASELAGLFKSAAGVDVPVGRHWSAGFVILLRRPSKEAAAARYPHQAYTIEREPPVGKEIRSLACGAVTDVGTYYAVKTLTQLLAPAIHGKGRAATVEVPAVSVADYPDLEERGEWGGSSHEDLEWMADGKFNLFEAHCTPTVDDKGVGHATISPELMERGRKHAVRIVPIIHHLEQIADSGLFKAYPQLRAVGAEGSICFARPEIVTVLSQWLTDLGKTPGVREVMIWLSEEGKGCECAECRKNDRFVNEERVCVAAWRQAQKACPGLGLRLLLTQASYPSNDKVLADVPADVKVSYYHGGLTYDTTRRPMIYPLLEEYVKRGRWLGVYPTMGANWLIVAPFSNPPFVHARLNEFVDKGLRCLVAYTVPNNQLYRVNVEGAMEWSWNARGRSPREFAAAYAVRHGIKEPEKFAEWAETLSPVSWDVYGSSFPYAEHWGGTERIARNGGKLGQGIFFEFHREEQLAEDLERCRAALALANETGDQAAILETRIVTAYVQVLQSVWELGKLIHGRPALPDADRDAARKLFETCDQACSTLVALYPKWGESATGKPETASRFLDTAQTMERLGGRMAGLMEQYGIPDKNKAYRLHVIGTWKSEEFAAQAGQLRRLDVTPFVDGPGVYLFRPVYSSGTLGLTLSKAELLSSPKDKPDDARPEAVDAHDSHCGAWVKDDTYRLELKQYDPERAYTIAATLHGGQTTNGEFYFRKVREGE